MSRKPNPEKSVQITFTLDKETADKLEEFMKIEMLPRSTLISRILRKYFEMK